MRYWELLADKLSKAGWTWGCVATVDAHGRTIFVADAHRDDGKRYVVHGDEKLTAFLELERVTRESLCFEMQNNLAQFFHDPAFIGLSPGKPAD